MDSFYFNINFRIKRFSISINPKSIQLDKWGDSYFDNESIFRYEFPQKTPVKSPSPPLEITDDDDDPIPF